MRSNVFSEKRIIDPDRDDEEDEEIHQEEINKIHLKRLRQKEENDLLQTYQKITGINIDSRFRNKVPINKVDDISHPLSANPLIFTENSNTVKIRFLNHKLQLDDKIIIQNITTQIFNLNNAFQFFTNSQYVLVLHPDHGINLNNFVPATTFRININDVEGLNSTAFIGNIPINLINANHQILPISFNTNFDSPFYELINNTPSSDDTINNYLQEIFQETGGDSTTILNNRYFIKLPITFRPSSVATTQLYDTIPTLLGLTLDQVNTITYLNIGGVPTTDILANYPVNSLQSQGFHTITAVESEYVYFETTTTAIASINESGGSSVIVAKILETKPGYPDTNEYTIFLQRVFTNVIKLELVSSEFYNAEKIVTENPESKRNNRLYWQNIEDGEHMYSVEVPEGNYLDPQDLIDILKINMNAVPRINSIDEEQFFHDFDFDLNVNTNVVTIKIRKSQKLDPRPLSIDKTFLNGEDRYRMSVKHINNSVQIGDTIKISGAISVSGVPSGVINTEHTIIETNITNETYTALLPTFNLSGFVNTSGGGDNVSIRVNLLSKFFFNRDDTLGKILGFRDVGENDAVTSFSAEIKNSDLYENETTLSLDVTGNPKSNPLPQLNFSGEYLYFFMYINDYEAIHTGSSLTAAFSKIILNGQPNDVLFNSFIAHPMVFELPVAQLDELRFKFVYPDGENVLFNNIDHSMSFRITEFITHPSNSRLNSKTTNSDTSVTRELRTASRSLVK